MTAATTAMITSAGRHQPSSWRGVSTPMSLQRDEQHGELEADAERQHHVQDQRDVLVRRVLRLDALARRCC